MFLVDSRNSAEGLGLEMDGMSVVVACSFECRMAVSGSTYVALPMASPFEPSSRPAGFWFGKYLHGMPFLLHREQGSFPSHLILLEWHVKQAFLLRPEDFLNSWPCLPRCLCKPSLRENSLRH